MADRPGIFLKRSNVTEIPLLVSPSDTSILESPGEFPFTRGIHPTMYRGRLWTMRQYAGFGTAQETNRRFRHLLDNGQTGLSVAFDLPTQMGYDADHANARGEVGRVGVSISSLKDMEQLFDQIPLDKVSTSMTINATAAILLCFYLALARKQGIPLDRLRGTIQNDILKEYIARGTYIFPPKPSLRIVTDLIAYCAKEVPNWNPISISGYHIREAGSDATQEVAFTLANACTYAQGAVDAGLDFDDFAGQLSFFFASHSDLIEEVAKFRAARRLWARLAKDRFGAKSVRSCLLRFHTQTAGSTLTAQQPDNNIVRVTISALAAILGGTQSLHTNSKDEALALPTEESATLALRTQQILAEESGIPNTVDPVEESYLIERETDRIEQEAVIILKEVDHLGGSVRAIETGYFQRAIADRAYEFQQQVERKERKIVGVNAYMSDAAKAQPILRVNPQLEQTQAKALVKWRGDRKNRETTACLENLKRAAETSTNLVPLILCAVEHEATLGEISDTLRSVFGQHQPV